MKLIRELNEIAYFLNQKTRDTVTKYPIKIPNLTLELPLIDEQAYTFFHQGKKLALKFDHFDGNFNKEFSFKGLVIKGQQLGRQWGIPTANIDASHMHPILQGIYCIKIQRKCGECHYGVASIGDRPTIHSVHHLLEVHIFDFSGNLYGEELVVTFLQKLRDEIKFSSIDSLIEQIKSDIYKAHIIFPEVVTYPHNPMY